MLINRRAATKGSPIVADAFFFITTNYSIRIIYKAPLPLLGLLEHSDSAQECSEEHSKTYLHSPADRADRVGQPLPASLLVDVDTS
jgi:hypothetical protein